MEINADKFDVYRGPNIYAPGPVIRYIFNVELTDAKRLNPGFVEHLLAHLPALREQTDTCAVTRILVEGSDGYVPVLPLFEHIDIALQNFTGSTLHCVRAKTPAVVGAGQAVVPYEDETVAIEAGRFSLELVRGLLSAGSNEKVTITMPEELDSRFDAFRSFIGRRSLPAQDRALIDAARVRDIPVLQIAGRYLQFGQGRFLRRVSGTITSLTDTISNNLAANKDYTHRVLADAGLPIAEYARVYRPRDAIAAAKRIGFPVVVKPNDGNMGRGVSIGVHSPKEVRAAYKRARRFCRSIIVQQFIPGADYRMLVVNGQLLAASKRVPAHVVGDGQQTIEQLVREVNSDPRRGDGQHNPWTRIEFDEQAGRLLAELGYDRTSTPPAGEIVYLRRNANTSDGGTAVDVTDQVHPTNRIIAERAAVAIGLDVAGVDLLAKEISEPIQEHGGVVSEINSRPGIRKHMWPAEGRPRDVAGHIIEMLFPKGVHGRITIAVITGTGQTATTARLLAHIFASSGATPGLVTRDGIVVGSQRLYAGPVNHLTAMRMLFMDPKVDAAVVEIQAEDILEQGLGFECCDVCAVISGAQRLPLEAVQIIAGSTRRAVVVGQGDISMPALLDSAHTDMWQVGASAPASSDVDCGFNTGRVHLQSDSSGKFACFRINKRATARIRIGTDGVESVNVDSALYAVTLAMSLGIKPKEIEQALCSFPKT